MQREKLNPSAELELYKSKTAASAATFDKIKRRIAGGVTANAKFIRPYPIVMHSASGSKLWDVDGNSYIDYCLGYGPLILGHGHPKVLAAIKSQLDSSGTTLFGTPHELELRMAERISSHYKAAELVRFTNSGTEATLNALRLAKAYTRREKIAKFEGHYHGWQEYALVSVSPALGSAGPQSGPIPVPFGAGVPKTILDNTVVLPFNDPSSVERIIKKEHENLAAVILEPLARGYMAPKDDFLTRLREITQENDVLLVFDEVMTGFRLGLEGGAGYFGVRPDLVALGKIIGGGLPCGAFGGRSDIISLVSPESSVEPVFHSGTYNACATVLAAGMATLDVLEEPGIYEKLDKSGEAIRQALKETIDSKKIDAKVLGLRSIFHVLFTSEEVRSYRDAALADAQRLRSLDIALYNRGIFVPPSHCCFLSIAHDEADVAKTIDAFRNVL
jgi:glutamate-1-semialdehyde 2,1-aminomutase